MAASLPARGNTVCAASHIFGLPICCQPRRVPVEFRYIWGARCVAFPVESRVVNPQVVNQASYPEYQMEMNQPSNRIHPLMAGAAVSVMLVSLLGIAAMTGVLPNSHATAAQTASTAAQVPAVAPISAPAQQAEHQAAAAPAVRDEAAVHKAVVHRHPVHYAQARSSEQYSQAPAYQQTSPSYQQPAPAYQQPAPAYQQSAPAYQQTSAAYQQPAPVVQNSPVGIGLGAVVGGLLGSQVGGGKGRTLATIAGVVGGGYLGNEIAKRYP